MPQDNNYFAESIADLNADDTTGIAYLGDPDILDAVLRSAAADALSGADEAELTAIAKNVAKELLGQGTCKGVPGWNEPGKIDAWLRRNGFAHADDTNPEAAVGSVILSMIDELAELAAFAEQPGVLDEQWQPEVETVYRRYRLIFTGIEAEILDTVLSEIEDNEEQAAPAKPKAKKWTKTQEALFKRWRDYP